MATFAMAKVDILDYLISQILTDSKSKEKKNIEYILKFQIQLGFWTNDNTVKSSWLCRDIILLKYEQKYKPHKHCTGL